MLELYQVQKIMLFKILCGLLIGSVVFISQSKAIAAPLCKTVIYTPPTAKQAFVGDLCIPKNQKRTIILIVHGGGGVTGSKEWLSSWADEYHRAGYATLNIDYRLFNKNEAKPVFPQPVQNVKAAVQYLRKEAKQLGIDPNRIVLHGSSAGATLAAQVLVSGGDSYFYGNELWANISDLPNGMIGFYGYYTGLTRHADIYFGGDLDSKDPQVQERIRKANAILNAQQANAPILLFHGTNDRIVPYGLMTKFVEALKLANKNVEAVTITDGIHGFDRTLNPVNFNGLSDLGKQSANQIFAWLSRKFPE
ncbi:alpha/beta hydrolase [Pseudanabaena sp. FACHB-1277]|jgi:acetyl esterase/lipase|uniref:Alpha/beta hydrolase n=1 Tax=Pseudanabaena cinerea FACHB-1277 TaxID=2949581 RepID=A0A926UWJ3_9CYAN|nr:alpha/beta hydrolase [Pseudanabaena cinerea]MBD2151330.1 alpha/beta hydrolase [Pseudanabaena cinerea FACHB-1277]